MVIVAAVDNTEFSGSIVERGNRLAEALGSELHVVHVMDPAEFEQRERESVKHSGRAIDLSEMRQIAKDVARDVASQVTEDFVPVGRIGDVTTELLDYLEQVDVDYTVLGGRKRTTIGKAILGSVTQDVLMNADEPVVIVMNSP